MGEGTLAGGVSKSEAAAPAVETKPLKIGVSLTDKMEVESNGVKDLQDDGKDLVNEKTGAGNEVTVGNDRQDGKGEGELKAEAMDVEAIKEENGGAAVEEKERDEDVDVNRVKDEKAGEEKREQQLGEGSKEEDTVEEVERSKEEKNAEEVEESKEEKNAEEVEESKDEKNPEEAEEGQEEKKEEDHAEGKLPNSNKGKVLKKRSRRKSFGVRRDRKKKERKEVEEEEAARREKVTNAKKNKKEEEEKENDEKELVQTPIVGRPVRERKSVERLVSIIEKDAHKEFKIEKGCGTPLKDIPNVASKLRRKNDDTLKLLHNLLFGQRCKAFQIRGHISRFSGFVWHEEEEKKMNKVKEKFDKCTKEKLLEICDVLDIPVSRASIKKEELVITLIDFLVAPHATTTVVLAEKESSKGQKRKRAVKQSLLVSAKQSGKSRKKSEDSSKSRRPQSDSDNDSEEEEEEEPENEVETENGAPEKSDDEMPDQSESEEKDVSEESGDETRKRKSKAKSSGKKDSAGKAKKKKAITVERPKKPSSRRSKVEDGDRRESSKKNEKGTKWSSTPANSAGKKDAKGKGKSKDVTTKPSDKELRGAICEILKEVDFNTATFTDILKQLAKQFGMDLTSSKLSIKLMIQEELTKLADEADDDEDDNDGVGEPEKEEGEAGKDEVALARGTEAKA